MKKNLVLIAVCLFVLFSLTACGGDDNEGEWKEDKKVAAESAGDGEQLYEDEFFTYMIPSDWKKDEGEVVAGSDMAMFTPADAKKGSVSGVKVKVNNMNTAVDPGKDYNSQQSKNEFLNYIKNDSDKEIKNPVISGYKTGEKFIYKVKYDMDVDIGVKASQTVYCPQNTPYSVSVYAIEMDEKSDPHPEEVAERIIETIEVKE